MDKKKRLGITRGMVNRTFTEYSGTAEYYSRKTGRKKREKFSFFSETRNIENYLQRVQGDDLVFLNIVSMEIKERQFSMKPEDFRRYATEITNN